MMPGPRFVTPTIGSRNNARTLVPGSGKPDVEPSAFPQTAPAGPRRDSRRCRFANKIDGLRAAGGNQNIRRVKWLEPLTNSIASAISADKLMRRHILRPTDKA